MTEKKNETPDLAPVIIATVTGVVLTAAIMGRRIHVLKNALRLETQISKTWKDVFTATAEEIPEDRREAALAKAEEIVDFNEIVNNF